MKGHQIYDNLDYRCIIAKDSASFDAFNQTSVFVVTS